mmetsp:Transcript_12244/g.23237  ORF Transcript_12244/g.23237 Transcript_12244/m.23237 type:complete len:234 (+) Transcript_12244:282-983(+)
MGACNYCAAKKPESSLPPGELIILEHEEKLKSMKMNNSQWVNYLKELYYGYNEISEHDLEQASAPMYFSLERFYRKIGRNQDYVRHMLKASSYFYNYSKFVCLTVHLSNGGVEDKAEGFIYSLTVDGGDTIQAKEFKKKCKVLANYTLHYFPCSVRDKEETDSIKNYYRRLLLVKRPIVNYFVKMFFGTSQSIMVSTLRHFLINTREGQALLSSSKMRLMAHDMFSMHSVKLV